MHPVERSTYVCGPTPVPVADDIVLPPVDLGRRGGDFARGFSETRVATGLVSPTAMAIAPDGRVFVAQKGGALRVVKNNALLSQPFLTLSVNTSSERGLLGVAFDPDFQATDSYTCTTPPPPHPYTTA